MGAGISTFLQLGTKTCLLSEADEDLKNGNFNSAIKSYTRCLEELGHYDKDVLANRSIAYLGAEVYSLALLDAESVLEVYPSYEKAIFCRIKCLWGLRKYQEAINFIETKLSKAQLENPSYKYFEVKAHEFLKQSKGEYDMCELFKFSRTPSSVIGEYEGPIEVFDIPEKGRGVYATADISPGQLLIACRSFAFAVGVDHQELRTEILTRKIINKLIHKDEFVRNEFRKGAVCVRQDSSAPTQGMSTSDKSAEQRSYIERMRVRVNNYMLINLRTTPKLCGIWPSASNFRNDCVDANAHIQFFGNVLMIRALNQIQKGQEITINRIPSSTLELRKLFMKGEEFECKCRLCIFEATESEEIKKEIQSALESLRVELEPLKHFGKLVLYSGDLNSAIEAQNTSIEIEPTTPKSQLKKALLIFKRITELRAENPTLNTVMFERIIHDLPHLLFKNEMFSECVEVLETARPAHNTAKGIECEIIASDRLIISCYLKLGDFDKVKEWVGIFKQDLVRAYGTFEILREMDKTFLKQFDNFQEGLDFFDL